MISGVRRRSSEARCSAIAAPRSVEPSGTSSSDRRSRPSRRALVTASLGCMGLQARRSARACERMKLGLHIGYWGLGLSSEEQLALVREAESLGYDSAWSAEAYGSDAATILGWLAQGTEK